MRASDHVSGGFGMGGNTSTLFGILKGALSLHFVAFDLSPLVGAITARLEHRLVARTTGNG